MKLSSMKPWKRSWRLLRSSRKRGSRRSGNSSCWLRVRTVPLARIGAVVWSFIVSTPRGGPRGGVESLDHQHGASQYKVQVPQMPHIKSVFDNRSETKYAAAIDVS